MRSLVATLLVIASMGTASAKTLVFCSEGNPEALNPQVVTTSTAMNALRPIFNNLVEFKPGSTEIVPGLAESWSVSEDGREYVFRLRSGVEFHSNALFTPSREFNADDVLFSIERQWREDNPFHAINGNYAYFRDLGMPDLLESVEKLDDYTVRIRLTRAEAPFLADLAMSFNAILSAEYAGTLLAAGTPELIDEQPVGTGPFVFDGFIRDVSLRYRAFDRYWRGRQPLDTLVFSITPNPAVRLTKLKAGECHVMAFPRPEDRAAIEASPDLRLLSQEELNIGYLSMNTTKAPFDDLRVRRAISMGIDRQAIIEAVYGREGMAAKNPIPPTLWSYNEEIEDYAYEPNAARALLVEAGFSQGFETELWYMPVSRPYNPNAKRIADMIADDLGKIGIRVKLVTDEWSAYRTKLQAGLAPMALFGWTGDNGDPDNFLHTLLGCAAAREGGNNVAKWCNQEYDALVTKAKSLTDKSAREQLYRAAQEIFREEVPWVPLAHSVVLMATRANVEGFVMDPLGHQSFEGVDLRPQD